MNRNYHNVVSFKKNANEGSWKRNHPKCKRSSGLGNLESSNIRVSGRRAME